ncbi:MAG TPA: hypothetical protein PKW80_16465 [Bacteroidales bacterium]|nr:hypothetical protein [Bacteroidales bacterium]
MNEWKLPPKEKIYEAFCVLADKRYTIESAGKAYITSSGRNKQYTLEWTEEHTPSAIVIKISSNDNASYWQGYTGYPIIAVLMIIDKLHFDKNILKYLKNIPWKVLNKTYNNNYTRAAEKILTDIDNEAVAVKIRSEVDNVFSQLSGLCLVKPDKFIKPPKD